MPYSLLVVDDEEAQLMALQSHLQEEGYDVYTAGTSGEAVNVYTNKIIDVVVTDFNLPEKDGLHLLEQIKSMNPEVPVIMVTAYGSIDSAVNAMKAGAYDYLTKPINIDEFLIVVKRACEHRALFSENLRLREALQERFTAKGIIAASGKMQEVLNLAGRVASSKASVLIRGESGTGKEVIAKTIHYASPRKEGPFIAFNVAALSPGLIENELFGHEKGAFTGADRTADGRLQQAHTGTLFIDEIGDIPIDIQAKFLRVLQENTIERLGSHKSFTIDIRVIAATNKDLEAMIREQSFREDLYYRLNVVMIQIPPLRDRKEDILPLCDLFISKYASENAKEVKGISREAFDALSKYSFPGNVRELENMIERAVVLARGIHITLDDLPPTVFNAPVRPLQSFTGDLNKQVEELEKNLITAAIRQSGGNQSKAARELNISERKLRYKLNKYGIGS